MNRSWNSTRGFTIIELVVVIVILGILAAIAVPKFVDMSGSAQTNVDSFNTEAGKEHDETLWSKCLAGGSSVSQCNIAYSGATAH